MKHILVPILCILLFQACSSSRKSAAKSASYTSDHSRTREVEFLDEDSYKLEETTEDKSYGYDHKNPIKVGGAQEMSGPTNERRFLNGLAGPNGEQVKYHRTGSCCGFRTPNGMDNIGLLDRYKVYWEGGKDTVILYINMYDKGDLKIPVGFTARR